MGATILLGRRDRPPPRHRCGQDGQSEIWSQLGVARSPRIVAIATPTAIAFALGLGAAALTGWLASGIGPVASVAVLDPEPSLGIPGSVLVLVLGLSLLILLARLTLGVHAAIRGRNRGGSGLLPGAAVAAVAMVAGAVVYSTNLVAWCRIRRDTAGHMTRARRSTPALKALTSTRSRPPSIAQKSPAGGWR